MEKKSIFSVYKLGFGLITASGLRIKEFPLYGMNKYYKMVGKKIIAEGFLPGREISVPENSAGGDIHCNTKESSEDDFKEMKVLVCCIECKICCTC